MFTAGEIRDTVFDKTARGYNVDDVNAFLAQLADQIETLQTEKADAESKMMMLAERLEGYRKDEDTLRSALITSERLKEAVLTEARQKAEILINDAQMKAEQLTNAANQELEREEASFEKLQSEVAEFKKNVLAMYKEHLEVISRIPEPEETMSSDAPAEIADEDFSEEIKEEAKVAAEEEAERDIAVEEAASEELPAYEPFTAFSATSEEPAAEDRTSSKFGQLDFGENFSFDN